MAVPAGSRGRATPSVNRRSSVHGTTEVRQGRKARGCVAGVVGSLEWVIAALALRWTLYAHDNAGAS